MELSKEMNYFYYKTALYELRMMNNSEYSEKLSYNSMLYLNVISQIDNCTVSRLAEVLNISKPAVTIKVNELVKQGLVDKKQSQTDKRVYYVTLSEQEEALMHIYFEIFDKIGERLKETYTPRQLELFVEMFRQVSDCDWSEQYHE